MRKLFLFYLISILYMEGVYHVAAFGGKSINLMLLLPLALLAAGVQTLVGGLFQEKTGKITAWVFLAIDFLVYFI